ncbi:ribonuclease H-like domain-containing protein [Tanacetum coccineum]
MRRNTQGYGVVSLIFNKAILKPTFCSTYAQLCSDLNTNLPVFLSEEPDGKEITFKRVLLNNCQEAFEGADKLMEETRQMTSPEQESECRDKERMIKLRILGNIRLIGKPLKQKIIPVKLAYHIVLIPNDDERVANDLNKGKSDSSSSSESGNNTNTADFPVDYGNDADSSNNFVVNQDEEDATLKENVFSEGNLDQNPSSSQRIQNVRREPKTYFEASKYPHWIDAMNQEMNALLRNGTWELFELPEGRKAIGIKWIYKIKFRSSGEIDRYKAILVEGIDYEETFSPVVKMVTVRCLLNIAVSMSWHVF